MKRKKVIQSITVLAGEYSVHMSFNAKRLKTSNDK